MELKDSRTYANLMAAFAGESQVRNKYEFYAAKAKNEGYDVLADIFQKTADNEREHAEIWLKLIHGGELPDTADNLVDAARGEHYEHDEMYAEFAQEAKAEGFMQIAKLFELVGSVEQLHADRYDRYSTQLQEDTLFKKEKEVSWICLNCGYEHTGTSAPGVCPVCKKGQGYFAVKPEDPCS